MWKKTGFTILIALLFIGSVAMIGWIGFQEKIRLAVQAFETEEQATVKTPAQDPTEQDHTVIETKKEATEVVKHLEGMLRTLEESNLPTE